MQLKMSDVESRIKSKLIDSCEKSMRTFKDENRISLNENQDAGDDNEEAEPFLVGDETHKQMPYTQEATTRTHYKRLTKYIRLIDYMLMDSKLSLIQNSISRSLEFVQHDYSFQGRKYIIGDKQQSCPLFEIELQFLERELQYVPSKYELTEAIKRAITEGMHIVCSNQIFLQSEEF